MTTHRLLLILLLFSAVLGLTHARSQAADGAPPLYMVIFRYAAEQEGHARGAEVIKVIDLLSGSNNHVAIQVPEAFIKMARRKIEDERFETLIQKGPTSGNKLTNFIYSPADEKNESGGISLRLLDGAMCSVTEFKLLGGEAALSIFGVRVGRSFVGVNYYAVDHSKTQKEDREAIINAEIQRSLANVPGAEVVSRKDLSTPEQSIIEITSKTTQNKALTIRCRYICNDRQLLALVATTPNDLSPEETQSFDRLFANFRFP